MGSEDFYPEERPVHRVSVDGFWMDETPVTAAQFRRFVRETNYVTLAERPLDAADYPTRIPSSSCRARSFFARPPARSTWTTTAAGGSTSPAPTGGDPGAREHHQRPRAPPRRPGRLRGRAGVRGVGGQGAADRGRVGVRRPRRARGRVVRVGRRQFPGGVPMANTWQGEFPWQNLKLDGYEGTSPVGASRRTATASSNGRERVGVDVRPFTPTGRAHSAPLVLRPPASARRALPPPRDQGRLAPVCAELLPALPPRRAAGRGDRHLDRPHRLPLHRSRVGCSAPFRAAGPNGVINRPSTPVEILRGTVPAPQRPGAPATPGRRALALSARRRQAHGVPGKAFLPAEGRLEASAIVQPPQGTVSRTALVNRLRASDGGRQALVAPAGYGKTTALAQWAERDERPFAWVSCDADDDARRLCVRIASALGSGPESLDATVLASIRRDAGARPSRCASSWPPSRSLRRPAVLVLDGAHLIRKKGCGRSRRRARASRAGRLHPRAGRTRAPAGADRPPACGRQALRGGAEELALTRRETERLRAWAGRRARGGGARRAFRASRGVADRRLPGRARAQGRRRRRVRARGGRPLRHRLPRLRGPVAARRQGRPLPHAGPRCWTRCADRSATPFWSPEGSGGSSRRSTGPDLFVVPLDRRRRSYRYQREFRDYLRAELERREPPPSPALYRRASAWCEEHGRARGGGRVRARGRRDRPGRELVGRHALAAWAGGEPRSRGDMARLVRRVVRPRAASRRSPFWRPGCTASRGGRRRRSGGLLSPSARRSESRFPTGAPRSSRGSPSCARRTAPGARADAGRRRARPRGAGPGERLASAALVLRGAAHLLLGEDEARGRGDGRGGGGGREHRRRTLQDRRPLASAPSWRPDGATRPARPSLRSRPERSSRTHGLEGYVRSALAFAVSARWEAHRGDLERAQAPSWSAPAPSRPQLTPRAALVLGAGGARARAGPPLARSTRPAPGVARPGRLDPSAAPRPRRPRPAADRARGAGRAGGGGSRKAKASTLTPAELRLLPLLATYLSFREIGENLFVSRNTVKTQAISVYRKLGVSSRSERSSARASSGSWTAPRRRAADFIRVGDARRPR